MERVGVSGMKYSAYALTLVLGLAFAAGCSAEPSDEELASGTEELRVTGTFSAKSSAYYPDDSELEGGFVDMKGKDLQTLQDFLRGKAKYVSVAMDKGIFKYGQRLRIREINQRYGKEVIFRVVDTGGAFYGKGRSRIDLCVANETMSFEKIVNSKLTIDIIDEKAPDPAPAPAPAPQPDAGSSTQTPAGGGEYCRGDGDCNPGNNGSGKICVSKVCVPGCKNDNHCPGVQTCQAGKCK
jgi:3D (Asp-Asp-Asp) domain-containing protein